MKDEVISYQTAVLAKEKGFDLITSWYYHPRYGLYYDSFDITDEDDCEFNNKNTGNWADGYYSAPTQSLLQRWLREVHGIDIVVLPRLLKDGSKKFLKQSTGSLDPRMYDSYEQALEAGLQEVLKLIAPSPLEGGEA